MDKSSIDALIDTCIIMGTIAGIPLGFGLMICLVMSNIIMPTIDYNISQDWIIVSKNITGGIPENQLILCGLSAFIMLIAFSIYIYLESKQSHETKIEDKK